MDYKNSIIEVLSSTLYNDIIAGWKLYTEDCMNQGLFSQCTFLINLSDEEMLCLAKIAAVTAVSDIGVVMESINGYISNNLHS